MGTTGGSAMNLCKCWMRLAFLEDGISSGHKKLEERGPLLLLGANVNAALRWEVKTL